MLVIFLILNLPCVEYFDLLISTTLQNLGFLLHYPVIKVALVVTNIEIRVGWGAQ